MLWYFTIIVKIVLFILAKITYHVQFVNHLLKTMATSWWFHFSKVYSRCSCVWFSLIFILWILYYKFFSDQTLLSYRHGLNVFPAKFSRPTIFSQFNGSMWAHRIVRWCDWLAVSKRNLNGWWETIAFSALLESFLNHAWERLHVYHLFSLQVKHWFIMIVHCLQGMYIPYFLYLVPP